MGNVYRQKHFKINLVYFLFLALLESNLSFNEVGGNRAEKIIGGLPAFKGRHRYVVAVMYESPGYPDQNVCTGAILSDWCVATVAHCFYDKLFGEWRTKRYYVAVGVHNLREDPSTIRKVYINYVTIPDTYNPNKADNYLSRGNLAIVMLEEALGLTIEKSTLAKLTVRNFQLHNYGGLFQVSGYGFTEVALVEEEVFGILQYKQVGKSDGQLKTAKGDVLTLEHCLHIIKDNVAPGNMCVKSFRTEPGQPVGICKFDSGAPLTHKGYLDGLAINGFLLCDEERMPGIYIDVLYYNRFINDALEGKRTSETVVLKQIFNTSTTEINQYGFELI